jgi:hypothetical protein
MGWGWIGVMGEDGAPKGFGRTTKGYKKFSSPVKKKDVSCIEGDSNQTF